MKKTFLIILILVLIAVLFSAWKVFGPSVSAPQDKFLYIKTGKLLIEMRNELISKKIISSPPGLIGYRLLWVLLLQKPENMKSKKE